MTGFHIRPESVRGDRVTFDAEETHHLAHVLRLEPGATIRAVDGRGHEITVRLTRVGGRTLQDGERRALADGDLIEMGPVSIRYHLE